MKSLGLFLALVVLTGCTTHDYRREGEKIIFGVRSWNHEPLDYVVVGADPNSFQSIKGDYANDKDHVYYRDKKIKLAKPSSFSILKEGYAKDDTNVYLEEYPLDSADPKTFEILEGGWGKDKANVFYGAIRVPFADRNTFRFVGGWWSIDGKRAYNIVPGWVGYRETGEWLNCRFGITVFYGIDAPSFEVIDTFHAKDRLRSYDALKMEPHEQLEPTQATFKNHRF